MRQFPFVVALVALGVAVFAFLTARDAARAVRETDVVGLDARLAAIEAAVLRSLDATDRPGALATRPAAGPSVHPAAESDEGSALAGQASPPSIQDLWRRFEALDKRIAEAMPSAPADVVESEVVASPIATPAWVGSLDDAEKRFELSSAQRAELDRVIADTKRDIDALRKVPDEQGTTWEAVERDVVRMENGAIHYDASKLTAFREQVIPGRNESFGAAMRRLRTEAARRMRDGLSPSQRETWDKTNTTSLLPGNDDVGGLGFISFGTGLHFGTPVEPDVK